MGIMRATTVAASPSVALQPCPPSSEGCGGTGRQVESDHSGCDTLHRERTLVKGGSTAKGRTTPLGYSGGQRPGECCRCPLDDRAWDDEVSEFSFVGLRGLIPTPGAMVLWRPVARRPGSRVGLRHHARSTGPGSESLQRLRRGWAERAGHYAHAVTVRQLEPAAGGLAPCLINSACDCSNPPPQLEGGVWTILLVKRTSASAALVV